MKRLYVLTALLPAILAISCAAQPTAQPPTAAPPTAVPNTPVPASTPIPPQPTPQPPTAVPNPPTATATLAPTAAPTVPPKKSGALRYVYLSSVDMRDIPILIALDALRAQGYAVEMTALASSALVVDVLARGNADIGSSTNQTTWTAIGKGADLTTIAQKFTSTTVLATKKEIKTCADLNGKSVAAASGNTNNLLLQEFVTRNCPGTKFSFVTISDTAARTAALVSGTTDAAIVDLEFQIDLERRSPGVYPTLVSFAKTFSDVQVSGIVGNRTWMKKNPDLVKDFLRALVQANRQVAEHPDVLYAEAAKRLNLDPAAAKPIADAYVSGGVWNPNGGMTLENVRSTLTFLVGINALPADLKAEDVADPSYLNAVLAELGRK